MVAATEGFTSLISSGISGMPLMGTATLDVFSLFSVVGKKGALMGESVILRDSMADAACHRISRQYIDALDHGFWWQVQWRRRYEPSLMG